MIVGQFNAISWRQELQGLQADSEYWTQAQANKDSKTKWTEEAQWEVDKKELDFFKHYDDKLVAACNLFDALDEKTQKERLKDSVSKHAVKYWEMDREAARVEIERVQWLTPQPPVRKPAEEAKSQ